MSPSQRIAGKVCVRRQLALPSGLLRNLARNFKCRRDSNDNSKIANSGLGATSFRSPFSITSSLRTITSGLSLQPSHDAPSGWLALSAFVGLPLALWAYKVRPAVQLVGFEP